MDARSGLIKRAEELPGGAWEELKRKPKYEVKTEERKKPENVKEQIIREREYKNIRLEREYVAEFEYQPEKCDEVAVKGFVEQLGIHGNSVIGLELQGMVWHVDAKRRKGRAGIKDGVSSVSQYPDNDSLSNSEDGEKDCISNARI